MSEHFLPGRTALLAHATEWLQRSVPAPAILEVGSGPGTTLRALRRDLPGAQLGGIDNDPVLRRLHDIATSPSARITVTDADLSDESWARAVPLRARPNVVLAAQILHYFSPPRFDQLLAEIRELIEPGGVLVHVDHVPAAECTGCDSAEPAMPDDRANETDPWARWWDAAADVPALTDAFASRSANATSQTGSAEYHPAQQHLEGHLRGARFDDIVVHERCETSLLTIATAR